jgi:hypothetical protein
VTRTRLLVGALVAVALLAVGGFLAWRLALRDTAEPVSVEQVLARYRREAHAAGTIIPPGVYLYETSGFEYVSALGGATHRYPRTTTLTVTKGGCGTRLRWDGLKRRSTTWTVCPASRGLRLVLWDETHNFFGQQDRTLWRCSQGDWVPADLTAGRSTVVDCRSPDTRASGFLAVVGEEAREVGDSTVDTVHLRGRSRVTGGASGTFVDERWVEPRSGLPVRIVFRATTTNPSPIGNVTFKESFDLRLSSLEPRR